MAKGGQEEVKRQQLSNTINEFSEHVPVLSGISSETPIRGRQNDSSITSDSKDVRRKNSAIVTLARDDAEMSTNQQVSIEDLTWTPALLRRKLGNLNGDPRQPKQTGF